MDVSSSRKSQKTRLLFQDNSGMNKKRGQYMKQKKSSIGDHLASLSVQYGCYPAELFQALVAAKETREGKGVCQNLTVEYRGSIDNEAIFLIKQNGIAQVQFRVNEETLKQKDLGFDSWMESDRIRKQIARQNPSEPVSTQVSDLRHGMKKVNVDQAKVLDSPQPKQVHTQFGNTIMMANVYVEDESGKIKLCLWDDQIKTVTAGDVIQIKNASVATFKGEKQLRLGKTGTITVLKNEQPKPNQTTKTKKPTEKVVYA